jgi:hypothetical protein
MQICFDPPMHELSTLTHEINSTLLDNKLISTKHNTDNTRSVDCKAVQ